MIIGRTNKTAENRIGHHSLLTKSKYYYISHLARDFILSNNITSLPVDLFSIIRANKWKIIKYSRLESIDIPEYNSLMKENTGFTEFSQRHGYVIYYNDSVSEHIQRFTLAHEIGHIMLNHFKVPIDNREQEANMFAARLLMPMCILHECKVQNAMEISIMCNVSLVSASYRYSRLQVLRKRNKFYTDANEKKVRNSFQKFIEKYNHNMEL